MIRGRTLLKLWLVGVATLASTAVRAAPLRNVILLIGDGMGPGQVAATRAYRGAPLDFETLPYAGAVTTFAAYSNITDSAAAATAIATGHTVDNGVLSLALPGDGRPLPTVLEGDQQKGRSAGLVTTSFMTDATPAAFAAHVANRGQVAEIAREYIEEAKPNVLFGSGGDGLSVEAAGAAGYTVVTDRAGLLALNTESATNVSGQFGIGSLPYESNWDTNLPHLSEMTRVALHILDNNPDGFFLMVEGGLIDHACHANDLVDCIDEVLEFNRAFQAVTNWAAGRGDTLIVVTADHETGGLAVVADNGAGNLPTVTWSAGGHTGAPVPVFGGGPHANLVPRLAANTDLFALLEGNLPALPVCRSVQLFVGGDVDLTMTWEVISGVVYRAESSADLSPGSWNWEFDALAGSDRLTITAPHLSTLPPLFYRLVPAE